MTAKDKQTPGPGSQRAAHREARLAKALRANLAKRKRQAEARAGNPASNPPESAPQIPGKVPRSA